MSPDEATFLRLICDAPADDLPRLVYADWLEEHGDPDRAEFIRLQVDRATRGDRGIDRREYELLARWETAWKAELPDGLRDRAVFRRGFVCRVRGRPDVVLAAWRDGGLARHPVEHLVVAVSPATWYPIDATRPAPDLAVRELTIDCGSERAGWGLAVGVPLVHVLTEYGPYPRLEALRIRDRGFGDDAAAALVPGPAFPRLTELDLGNCGIGDAGAEALAESHWPRRLRRLRLTGNPISPSRVGWLSARFGPALVV